MHEQQSKKAKHTQDPGTTNLYLANIGSGGSWVRGKRRHGLAIGRGKKPILGFLLRVFWGEMSCWDDMPPKRSKDELEPLGACHNE